jgi:hypothetical protein
METTVQSDQLYLVMHATCGTDVALLVLQVRVPSVRSKTLSFKREKNRGITLTITLNGHTKAINLLCTVSFLKNERQDVSRRKGIVLFNDFQPDSELRYEF